MKKIFLALMAGVMLASCDLNFFPSDELSSEVLLQDAGGAEYIMDGCYALLKDEVEFLGYSSGNYFARHLYQLSEFPADNCCLSSHTTDPLYEATALKMTDNLKNVGTLWMIAYKVIFMTNTVIETTAEGASAAGDHLIGEAYFVRAWMHLNLVNLYAKPYLQDRNNLGVPLHISTANDVITRAKVGDVYDQIVKDLKKASELMGASRGNAGYPSKNAALGLLSRVYLNMGNWQEVVNTVDAMLAGGAPASKLDGDYANYFINAKTSQETLFCIAHEATDTRAQSSIGSMYYHSEDPAIGWGEIYPSVPLLYLYERYPEDVRYAKILEPKYMDRENSYHAYFPTSESSDTTSGYLNMMYPAIKEGDDFRLIELVYDTIWKDNKKTEIKELKIIDTIPLDYMVKKYAKGEYFEYRINYNGEDCLARVHKSMQNRNTHPIWYNVKFSYQDGDAMLSSPVVCRWAEVILNRAEAYAHLGQDANALEDVNVIRNRAGIPAEGMFAAGNMHGYASALDVVLDERRMELAFEGHRLFDLLRNNLKINRQFPGAQPWEIVEPTDNRLQYPIPNNEWTVSGIEQNPGY